MVDSNIKKEDEKETDEDIESMKREEFYKLVKRDEELTNKLQEADSETEKLIQNVIEKKDEINFESNKLIGQLNQKLYEERTELDKKKDNLKRDLKVTHDNLNPSFLTHIKYEWSVYAILAGIFSLIGIGLLYFGGSSWFLIYLLLFYFISIYLMKWFITAKHNYDSSIREAIEDFEEYDFSKEKINNIEMKIKQNETDATLKTKRNDLEKAIRTSIDFAKNKLPYAKEFVQTWDNLKRYEDTLDDLVSSLEYYGLPASKYKKELESKKVISTNRKRKWEENIISLLNKKFMEDGWDISEDTIDLIYAEYSGNMPQVNRLWRENKEQIIPELSKILIDSDILPTPYVYSKSDLDNILGNLNKLDLDTLRDKLFEMSSIVNTAESYMKFLNKNEIESDLENIRKKLYLWFEKTSSDEDAKEIKILILTKLGKKIFKDFNKDFSDEKAEGFTLYSLALFYDNNAFYLEKACMKAGLNDYAIKSTYQHLKLLKEYSETDRGVPTIKDVIDTIDEINEDNEQTKQNIENLQNSLQDGKWETSYSHLIENTMKSKQVTKKLKERIKLNEKIMRSIKNLFNDVQENTIEKVLDTELFSAYLITFDCDEKSIAVILKKLESKYRFRQYTDNSRVGIVLPEYESFKEFKDNFKKDFSEELQNEQKDWEKNMKNPNVNIQRVTPSEHTFETIDFDTPNFDKVEKDRDKNFLEIVKDLVKEEYDEEEIFDVIWYDRNVNLLKILNELTIYDLIYQLTDLDSDEEELLSQNGLWDKIVDYTNYSKQNLTININMIEDEIKSDIEKAMVDMSKEIGYELPNKRAREFTKKTILMLKRISELKDEY